MSLFSRFTTAAAIVTAPFLFTGCSEEGDAQPDNAPKALTGTATQYIISVAPTGRIHAVYMDFKDQNGKLHKSAFNPADPGSSRDQASQVLSTDNFLSDESVVRPNQYNQLVLMQDNKEFSVYIDVDPEDEQETGVSSIRVTVPSRVVSSFEYASENDVITLTKPENRDKLSGEVTRVVDLVGSNRFKVILDQ